MCQRPKNSNPKGTLCKILPSCGQILNCSGHSLFFVGLFEEANIHNPSKRQMYVVSRVKLLKINHCCVLSRYHREPHCGTIHSDITAWASKVFDQMTSNTTKCITLDL